MSFGSRLKSVLKSKHIYAKDLAERIGVSRGLVTHWTNDVRNPNPEQVKAILEFLNINSSVLFDNDQSEVLQVPVIGTASCGGVEMNFLQDTHKTAPYNGDFYTENLYCVIANGDSMATDIEDGDEVICDPDVEPKSGDMVHYRLGDESAIKILWIDEDAHLIQLVPYNQSDDFKTVTIRLDDEQINDLTMSKVVAVNKLKLNNRAARLRLIGRG